MLPGLLGTSSLQVWAKLNFSNPQSSLGIRAAVFPPPLHSPQHLAAIAQQSVQSCRKECLESIHISVQYQFVMNMPAEPSLLSKH
jgi:hypothetical protein